MMKKILRKLFIGEKGQALPAVLILLAVGGLIIAPLLSYMSSGIKVSESYEEIAEEFYAADSGVEDALWHINSDNLESLFDDYERYYYNDDDPYEYPYLLDVNNMDVTVQINNIWIPKDIDAPTVSDAEALIGAGKLITTGAGSSASTPENRMYEVKIYYYQEDGDGDLYIETIGIWLPPGFSYDTESDCELEEWLDTEDKNYTREITSHSGGEAVVWTLTEDVLFTEFPGVSTSEEPMAYTFDLNYLLEDPDSDRTIPEAVSWVTTSGVDDIPYTWDADVRVFHIYSQADSDPDDEGDETIIDAYAIKNEARELESAVTNNGDYVATGNSLLVSSNPRNHYRDVLLDESSATINEIPDNATVEHAFLYWSAWVYDVDPSTVFSDDCYDMSNWIPGPDWQLYIGWGGDRQFKGHHQSSHTNYLTMGDDVDLSMVDSATISWDQSTSGWLEGSDCLKFEFSSDGGDTWGNTTTAFCGDNQQPTFEYEIPGEYLTAEFKVRFYLDGFSGGGWFGDETCYLDNITISSEASSVADTATIFKINGDNVYYTEDEEGELTVPTIGSGDDEIIATNKEGEFFKDIPNYNYGEPAGYSYACCKDVTDLVNYAIDEGIADEGGNATYTLGGVDATPGDRHHTFREWAYAGWSLIIVYTSPETQGHQLWIKDYFLYCDHYTNLDFDQDGQDGGTLSPFLVPDPIPGEEIAAKITCFVGEGDDWYEGDYFKFEGTKLDDGTNSINDVWNGRSVGMSAEGVDIDTFYVEWDDGLLEPGDTSAHIDMYTEIDGWNLIYIVISVRSSITSGGTISYLIRN